jgi:hypothetical protein
MHPCNRVATALTDVSTLAGTKIATVTIVRRFCGKIHRLIRNHYPTVIVDRLNGLVCPAPGWYARPIIVRTTWRNRVVAIVEIVSPDNKDNRYRLQSFIEKTVQAIRHGIHVLLIDLLPPGKLDTHGLQNELWLPLGSMPTEFRPELPLTLASHFARPECPEAFIEPTAVGCDLIPMPSFLEYDRYIEVPS